MKKLKLIINTLLFPNRTYNVLNRFCFFKTYYGEVIEFSERKKTFQVVIGNKHFVKYIN